jgi:cytochrome c oxidase subunit 3
MSQQTTTHEPYYVPAQSKWPIIATVALLTTVFGLGTWFNDLKAERAESHGPLIFFVGALLIAYMLFGWFGAVVREGRAGLYSPQMDRSFRWGMMWFIFSEVMFFLAFFGALFYIRYWVGPWLGGDGDKGVSNMLWPNFEYTWPLLNNPDPQLYPAPEGTISAWGLPLVNTILLVSSSFTLTFAHHALRKGNRKHLKLGLGVTVLLGASFLALQVEEYMHAYTELGLTLGSGIYGATFFMLTGFHGAHVTIGAIMLSVMLARTFRNHFTPDQHFGFEAAAWYWHFVDVVWIGLFIFVYVL